MELNKNTRVYFEETSHSYLLDNEVLLEGVTSLLKKHNLSADYGDIPKAVLDKAAEEGTAIHREIQSYEKGETIFASPLIDDYKKYVQERGLRFVEDEYLISDDETVASSIDMVYEVPKGAVIADIKTTQKYHRRAVEWQISIYKYLFEKANPTIPVVGTLCIWIDKKSKKVKDFIDVNPVTTEEVEALLQAEKQGLIYIDENAKPDIEDILSDDEATQLTANAAKIVELEATLKALKAVDEAVRTKLSKWMEQNNVTEIACNGGVFKLKAGFTTNRVDADKLKEQFPAVYQKVTKQSFTKASVSFKPDKQ